MDTMHKRILSIFREISRSDAKDFVTKNNWILDMWREYAGIRDKFWESREKLSNKYQEQLTKTEVVVQLQYDEVGEVTGIQITNLKKDKTTTIPAATLEEML